MTDGHTNDRPDGDRPDGDRPDGDRPAQEAQEPWWAVPTTGPDTSARSNASTTPDAAPPPAAAYGQQSPDGEQSPYGQQAPYAQQPGHDQAAYEPRPVYEPPPTYEQPPTYEPPLTYGQPPAFGQPPTYGQPPVFGQPSAEQQAQQPPSTIPSPWQSAYGPPAGGGRRAEKRGRGLPSLLLVAVVAAVIGAAVGSGFVAAGDNNSKTGSSAGDTTSTSEPTSTTSLPAGSVASVASALLPSVVSIIVTGPQEQDEGTGIVLSNDGQIVTNNHVVEAAASSGVIAVTFSNGHTVTASIVGRDPTSDLAVIKVQDQTDLHPAQLGDDSSLVVGQQVVAVGSPLGLSNTVTSGIVSSLNRPVCTQNCGGSGSGTTPTVLDAIQTDAAINPGNSGGPLVDLAGRVVGINSAIATLDQQSQDSQSGNIGVGFAIPIDDAKRIISELETTGHAEHALFGIGVADSVDGKLNTPNGAKIVSVTSGGAADKAGLKVGDIVVKFGNRALVDADSLIAATHAAVPNSTVTITYLRGGKQSSVQVTLGSASGG